MITATKRVSPVGRTGLAVPDRAYKLRPEQSNQADSRSMCPRRSNCNSRDGGRNTNLRLPEPRC